MDPDDLSISMPEKDPEPTEWDYCLTKDEVAELYRWRREHNNKHHDGKFPYCGAIGGQLTVTFCSTGLGTISGVECNLCHSAGKDKLDYMHCLTDFSDW